MNDRLRLVFAGTPDFAVPALDALHAAGHGIRAVYTQPDRPAGRGQALAQSPVKRRATELGLVVEQPATLRSDAAAEGVRAHGADLMVVVAYGLILPPAVLAATRLGCWNIHASLLPRWRGAAPIQRAILAGDTETGITIMQMDAGLDTGPILLERAVAIGPRDTGGTLHDRLASLGAAAIVEAIDAWQGGGLSPRPQPAEGATYAPKLHKDEARIDWNDSAAAIERRVRAFDPWPVAETLWRGQQLRIWQAEVDEAETAGSVPGTVLDRTPGRILVATGCGALSLGRVQLAGRRAVTAVEFLNAHPLAGARLG
ncbi:MAG: methionyl-tRNA formyltransferase [Lysobacterales bacterium]|jgi:methionyl-tRNA formyltransferase|nr:MAG: methionyl-tRNA formyltransferase [Xanthomonadales bacterium]